MTWLPVYLLLLLAATLFPFRLTRCSIAPWDFGIEPHELVKNFFLFVPLGFALGRRHLALVFSVALLCSGALEFAQGWLARQPSALDVLGNTLGAIAGAMLSRALPRNPELSMGRGTLCAAAAVGLAATLASTALRPVGDFSNWKRFPLIIGNEATGDRPWSGHLAEFAVYDRALAGDPPGQSPGAAPPLWSRGGPILWVRLEDPPAARLDGPEGPENAVELLPNAGRAPLDARSLEDPLRLPDRFAAHLHQRLGPMAQLTVSARVRPDRLDLSGPARIVSFSRDPLNRNFTLSQEGREVNFRVRTPATGPNGVNPKVETLDSPLDVREHRIVATFDGEVSRIIVDSVCRRETLIAVSRAPALLGRMLGATIVLCTALGGLAIASIAPSGAVRLRVVLFCAGGSAAWLTLWLGGTWDHVSGFGFRAVILGPLALATSASLLRSVVAGRPPRPVARS